jgi:hypothetical protein
MYDPGDDLAARYPDWVWRRRDLRGIPEVLCPVRKVILTDRRLSRVESRCTLAHAVAHLDLGHVAVLDGVVEAQEEVDADKLAARRLVSIHDLADAALEERPVPDLADSLKVTEVVLQLRDRHMHPSERGYLRRRLSMKEVSA